MTDTRKGLLERLAARTQPTATLATLESTLSIARVGTMAFVGATIQTALVALVFFWFDEPIAAWSALGLALSLAFGWSWYAATGRVAVAMVVAVVAGLTHNLIVHLALGGYANSGAYLMWGISLTVATALVLGKKAAITVGLINAIAAVVLGFAETSLAAGREAPDATLSTLLFVVVMIGSLNMTVPIVLYLFSRLSFEREQAEGLLLNVLPAEVAAELKEHGETTAQRFDGISVLFADIVGFTPLSASMEPEEMVAQLNGVFTHFDTLAERHGVEKIRTIGDNYMVASGVPTPRDDHAQALAAMALEMLGYSEAGPLSFRIGINSGPAVAGVIGTRKFQYDIWGDTVNTASRMESHGEPGRIQIAEDTYELIGDTFTTTRRGPIDVKGKGILNTWWLDATKQTAAV